jgi:transposase
VNCFVIHKYGNGKQRLLVAAEPCASSPATQSQRVHTKERRTRHPIAKSLAWLLVQSPEALRPPETATLAWIAQDAEVARVSALVPRLAELVRSCGIGRDEAPAEPLSVLKSWLDEAASCGIQALETFAAGLRQDEAAIRAALTMPWSSGQAEGQINKLKLIKRQMYGRAKFDLIRRRVLLAA